MILLFCYYNFRCTRLQNCTVSLLYIHLLLLCYIVCLFETTKCAQKYLKYLKLLFSLKPLCSMSKQFFLRLGALISLRFVANNKYILILLIKYFYGWRIIKNSNISFNVSKCYIFILHLINILCSTATRNAVSRIFFNIPELLQLHEFIKKKLQPISDKNTNINLIELNSHLFH